MTTDPMSNGLLTRMYQYSRAIYRSVKDLIEPFADRETQLEARRSVLAACEETVERLAKDPRYFSHPERTLFQDVRRHFPIAHQAQVQWAITQGINAAADYVDEQIEAGGFDRGASPRP